MANIKIGYDNLWDSVENVTASSEETYLIAENTQQRSPTFPWRTTGVDSSGDWIKNRLGAGHDSNFCALLGCNMTASATVILEGSDNNFVTTEFTETLARYGDIWCVMYRTHNARDYRITITDTGNGDGYIEVGRIWIEDMFEPSVGFAPKQTIKYDDYSNVNLSERRQATSIEQGYGNSRQYQFNLVDKDNFDAIYNIAYESYPIILVEKEDIADSGYENPGDYLYYGRLNGFSYKKIAKTNWSCKFTLIEEK